jgi:hypothetical protein
MTILNSFIKKRIEQLLTEYGSPDLVIEQLRDIIPGENPGDSDEMLVLEDYIRNIWKNETNLPDDQYNYHDFTDGDLAELMYLPDEYPQNFKDTFRKNQAGDISEEMLNTLNALEESFCEALLEEELETQMNLANLKLDFSKHEDKIQKLSLVTDIIKLIRYLDSARITSIPRKQDGDIKRNFIKKAGSILESSRKQFSNIEDYYNYIELLFELITESQIIVETDEGQLHYTKISSEILKDKINYPKIYSLVFKTWWMDFRDFFVDKLERPVFIEPDEIECKIASLLLTSASSPAIAQDIYVPTIINGWLEFLSYRTANQNDGKMAILQGIKDTHIYYFRLYFMMGILEIVSDENGLPRVQLSDLGKDAMKAIVNTYSPLLKADVQLTTSYDIIKSFLIVSSLFFPKKENEIHDHGAAELQQMASEIEVAINSFFLYVADPANNRENINQIKSSSDFILEKVFEAVSAYKKTIRYNDIVENLFTSDPNGLGGP